MRNILVIRTFACLPFFTFKSIFRLNFLVLDKREPAVPVRKTKVKTSNRWWRVKTTTAFSWTFFFDKSVAFSSLHCGVYCICNFVFKMLCFFFSLANIDILHYQVFQLLHVFSDSRRLLNVHYDSQFGQLRSYELVTPDEPLSLDDLSSPHTRAMPLILTVDVQRALSLFQPWLQPDNRQPFILVGPEGCGKRYARWEDLHCQVLSCYPQGVSSNLQIFEKEVCGLYCGWSWGVFLPIYESNRSPVCSRRNLQVYPWQKERTYLKKCFWKTPQCTASLSIVSSFLKKNSHTHQRASSMLTISDQGTVW